ncbi:MAG TPA: copper oxidase [Terriglobia bacterium]|nr:copper oxidase [Terriglobia bacterium]
MSDNRRQFFRRAMVGSLAAGATRLLAESAPQGRSKPGHAQAAKHAAPWSAPAGAILPVVTPDVPHLPYTLDGAVKVFNLTAGPVRTEIVSGRVMDAWGYNGSIPGPAIEVVQGDRVRLVVDNHLPEPTSMHWHGFEIPIAMDGMPGISQPMIPPGGRFVYEFTLHQAGTFFYHSHAPMQSMMGLIGLFIMHPREPLVPRVDRDYGLILQEWAILPNNTVPNTMSMEFNWLTMNGKAAPATTPLIARLGDRVRIRLVNLGMDHHPIHLHGNTFYLTGTEGGRVPQAAWTPANTVLVGVAQARDIEFEANNPGDWMLHCHMPHHMMNHMASMVGPMMESGHGTMHALPAGMGMPEGMGMVQQGGALDPENGPSLGRAIGIGADYEKPATNAPLDHPARAAETAAPASGQHEQHAGNPWQVPGFPQDMMMNMIAPNTKPETYGLPSGWASDMAGMMTLVRVLEPGLYDQVMARVGQQS